MASLPEERLQIVSLRGALVGVALGGLVIGAVGWASGAEWHSWPWAVATALVLAALAVEIVRSLSHGDVGLDLVAALSMSAALAFGEMLAGNVVALMYAGGQYLEGYAAGRARREMTALLGRVAHSAMRYGNGGLDEVLIQAIVARRPDPRPPRRGDPGRRKPSVARRRSRQVRLDRREPAPRKAAGRRGPERVDQRRRCLRSRCGQACGRKHLRQHRAAGHQSAGKPASQRACGGPLRDLVPVADACAPRALPGASPATLSECWPCWWWRRRVRLSSLSRSPSSPACRAPPRAASSSRTAALSRRLRRSRRSSSTRPEP